MACDRSAARPAMGEGKADALMPSFAEECSAVKGKYDTCFNSWFKGYFLQGHEGRSNKKGHDEVCGCVFAEYHKCFQVQFQVQFQAIP